MKKLNLSIFTFSALAVIYFSAAGCYHPVDTVENAEKSMERNFVKTKQRVVTHEALSKRMEVVRTDSSELSTGLLQVQATLRNKKRFPYKFSYKFIWFDESGMVVDTPASTWIEKDILGGDTIHISQVAPNERCKDFLIKFQLLE